MEGEREPQEKGGVEEEEGNQHLGHVHAHVHVDAESWKPKSIPLRQKSRLVEEFQPSERSNSINLKSWRISLPASEERQLHPSQEHRHGAEMGSFGVVRVEKGQVGEGASEHQQLEKVLEVFEVLWG